MTAVHPAALIPYTQLYTGLEIAAAEGLVNKKTCGDLSLYCYSKQCVFDKAWNDITKIARGIILSPKQKRVVAYTFPKFFNYGELGETSWPNAPYDIFEKLDGSLIICYFYDGQWNYATKGSFSSDQALKAKELMRGKEDSLIEGNTYLFEYVGPSNLIVIKYPEDTLRLLGGYSSSGEELDWDIIVFTSIQLNIGWANKESPREFNKLLADAENLPASEEGWVIRFSDGYRLKIKGSEYKRIHATLNHLTPLSIWRLMREGEDDLLNYKYILPEEFWDDFNKIHYILFMNLGSVISSIELSAREYSKYSDKELGLISNTLPKLAARFIFSWRKKGGIKAMEDPKFKNGIFDEIRPTSNYLKGYIPSYGLKSIQEEEG